MSPPAAELNTQVSNASKLIKEAAYCIAISGAGISTPSGIPDFRSPGSGVWTKYSPMEVASLSAFRYNPGKFYDWLRPFVKTLYKAEPNPAHLALAMLEDRGFLQSIITQNIDALHQKSGSQKVIEVHGTYSTMTCIGCYQQIPTDQDLFSKFLDEGKDPFCEECGRPLKPDLILYEEQLPADKWKAARREILACDLILVLGSSLTVTPVCDLPLAAMANGAKMIIINNSHTHLDHMAAEFLQGDLAELLPVITEKVLHEKED